VHYSCRSLCQIGLNWMWAKGGHVLQVGTAEALSQTELLVGANAIAQLVEEESKHELVATYLLLISEIAVYVVATY
jgi:hypothetical protein